MDAFGKRRRHGYFGKIESDRRIRRHVWMPPMSARRWRYVFNPCTRHSSQPVGISMFVVGKEVPRSRETETPGSVQFLTQSSSTVPFLIQGRPVRRCVLHALKFDRRSLTTGKGRLANPIVYVMKLIPRSHPNWSKTRRSIHCRQGDRSTTSILKVLVGCGTYCCRQGDVTTS